MNPEIFVWSVLSPESLIPVIATAGGIAWGISYAIRQPQLAQLKMQTDASEIQVRGIIASFDLERKQWQEHLELLDKVSDEFREKLDICRHLNHELGQRIRELESKAAAANPQTPQ